MVLESGVNEQGLIDAAIAIAEERENITRALARAVLAKDYETAERLAKEIIPHEAQTILRRVSSTPTTDEQLLSINQPAQSFSASESVLEPMPVFIVTVIEAHFAKPIWLCFE